MWQGVAVHRVCAGAQNWIVRAIYRQGVGGRVRRDRLPGRRDRGTGDARGYDLELISGADVVLAGFFSAKQKDYAEQMDDAAGRIGRLGGRVVARLAQRRGVSDGGVAAMSRPYSRKTIVSGGKAREIAMACDQYAATAVVFLNPLSPQQQHAMSELFGRPVASLSMAGAPDSRDPSRPPADPPDPAAY